MLQRERGHRRRTHTTRSICRTHVVHVSTAVDYYIYVQGRCACLQGGQVGTGNRSKSSRLSC